MKIRIIGGSGSGKTYLSKILSQKYSITHFDLDDIFWDNNSSSWGKKSEPEIRAMNLEKILLKDSWIIEGVYHGQWTKRTFEEADQVIVLTPNVYLQHWRATVRWFKRKFGLISSKKKETIRGLIDLILWNHRYNKKDIPPIKKQYQKKSHAEYWDVYNKERQKTGRTIKRGNKIVEGDYHLVVHIWIKNSKDEFLIQKRPNHLDWMPRLWATTGGSALAGEESLEAAIRETKEELGITVNTNNLSRLFTQTRIDDITDVWLFSLDLPISKFKFDKNEVTEIRWENKKNILQMLRDKTFIDYGEGYFKQINLV